MKSRLAFISFLNSQEVDPGFGVDAPVGPDNSLPPGAAQLPVFPFDPTIPDNSLPGQGGHPDQGLPGSGGHPSQPIYTPIRPGVKFVVKWLACKGLILVPDNSLPGQGGHPDQGLPGSQPGVDNTLPGNPVRPDNSLPGSQPKPDQGLPGNPVHPSQGLPPTAQPKK